MTLDTHFPRYTDHTPLVPIHCLTPDFPGAFHRFFDTSPLSPSGRYLAVTRWEHEERMPRPGEPAQVLLVNLETGKTEVIAESHGWDTQLGAQVQWGADDSQLFFNDMDCSEWRAFGVLMNPATGQRRELDGTVYMVTRDGARAVSPCLLRTGRTQPGYGVLAPPDHVPRNHRAPVDDGIYLTDVKTGRCGLLASFHDIVHTAVPAIEPPADGDCYGFHVKWTPHGNRVMLVLRVIRGGDRKGMQKYVVTMQADGSDIRVAVPDEWWRLGGHHPDWSPDGEWVTMNLKLERGGPLRLVRVRWDGTELAPLTTDVIGSGHPSLHPDGRHLITDSYLKEPVAFGDGTTPLRWIDIVAGTERCLARIRTAPDYPGPSQELRVDPHPAWDRDYRRVIFNACPDGRRRVFVADLSELVDAAPAD